jgi:hypothetical protein
MTYMKYFLTGICFFLSIFYCNSQIVIRIEGIPKLIRYYPKLKLNEESVNDSISYQIRKNGNDYLVKVVKNDKAVMSSCLYKLCKTPIQQYVTIKEDGVIKTNKINVYYLLPKNVNCVFDLEKKHYSN